VLLVPVGGGTSLTATQAAEVISLIEPFIVIPMHYKTDAISLKLDPVDKFLKELGSPRVEPIDMLKVTKSSLPQETQVMVLSLK
jgi:L-ascorbate metabolism protein UlaG (beta-lactamase superfamily)